MANEIMVLDWKGRKRDDHKIVKVLFLFPIDTPIQDGGGTNVRPSPSTSLPGIAAMPEAESGVSDDWKALLDSGDAMFTTKVMRFGPWKTAFVSMQSGVDGGGNPTYKRFERYVDAAGVELADQNDEAVRVPMSVAVMRDWARVVYVNEMEACLAKYTKDYADVHFIGLTADAVGGA